jgi:hypothetical protein
VTNVRALTVKQPWASLIAMGIKDIENRTWVPAQFHGPILIHAGASVDKQAMQRAQVTGSLGGTRLDELPTSAIVAVVGTVRAHRDSIGGHCEPWGLDDCWHWVLSDVRQLPKPIPATGRLGLWIPGADLLAAVEAQYTEMEVAW